MTQKEVYIKVTKNGPYLVYGITNISQKIILADEGGVCLNYGEGKTFEIKSNPVALCRCGNSKNAPFCDGSHFATNFDGTETATFEPILDNANTYEGKNLILKDNEKFCALARFCDAHGGIWDLILTGKDDEDAVKEANLCPSGRLIIFDKDGNIIEDELPQSIAALEDEGLRLSGPLWVRGGIRVESENGESYEIRNRQTICRCGNSCNKPFCNGSHAHSEFKAKYKNDS